MTRVPLSVLDLSPFGSGQTPADGLRSSIRLARAAHRGDGERFADDVADILAFFAGPHDVDGVTLEVTPASGQDVEVWIHGSTAGPSARLAGERGLPFGANYHVAPAFVLEAIAEYRSAFRPGKLAAPHVIVSVDVLVADTDERARALASGYGRWVHGIRTGGGAVPYPAPGDPSSALSPDEEEVVRDRLATRFVGSPGTVVAALETLQRVTGADELLITTIAHDPAAREESYRLLAQAWASDTSTPRTDAGAPTTSRASDDPRIDVRLVRTDEYERAGEVTAQAYLASYGGLSEAYLASLRDVAARVRDGDVWVAVDRGGVILGSIWVARADRPLNPDIGRPGETDFRQLAVAAHARGRGIGAALTRHVVSLARERGSHRVVMNSGPEMTGAHALYAKLGFRRLPEREHAREIEPGRVVTLLAFGYDVSPDPHEPREASEPRAF